MYIHRGNSSPLFPGNQGSSSLQGSGFASFSFSASFFSSATLNGLNQACGCHPHNPALNTLGSLFTCMSMLQSFQNCCGSWPGCFPQPHIPTFPQFPTHPTHPHPPKCPPTTPGQQKGKMWDVFFDSKDGTQTQRLSPLVLDLNGNGKADITGSNITGNNKLEGTTVKGFDLNPENRQWSTKSLQRRPGNNAPGLPEGTTAQVFDQNGKLVKTLSAAELKKLQSNSKAWKAGGGDMGLGLGNGMRAEFRDPNGTLVSELKRDPTVQNQLLYFWGNKNENEWTKAWDSKTGGDGMLVWDTDGDGKITSGKELFGHVDLNGKNTFKNGYEKLAHYFDKNGDGVVKGSELNGLKIWEDRNGDGITQDGELVSLEKHGINKLNTSFNSEDMSSSYGFRDPSRPTVPPPTPGPVYYPTGSDGMAAMQQTWQIFQMIEVMRQMQMSGYGLS